MKNLKKIFVLAISFLTFSFSVAAQEEESIEAVFTEFDGTNYNFAYTDIDGEEMHVVFNNIDSSVENIYDLTGDDFKGQLFLITYKEETQTEESDGETLEFTESTIIDLQKQ